MNDLIIGAIALYIGYYYVLPRLESMAAGTTTPPPGGTGGTGGTTTPPGGSTSIGGTGGTTTPPAHTCPTGFSPTVGPMGNMICVANSANPCPAGTELVVGSDGNQVCIPVAVPAASSRTISGTVRNPSGIAMRSVVVALRSADAPLPGDTPLAIATTSSFGVFTFDTLTPGEYIITVDSGHYRFAPLLVDVTAASSLNLELEAME